MGCNLSPRRGHVSNFCDPIGTVIEPMDIHCFQNDRCELLIRVHDRHPVWTHLELVTRTKDNFRMAPKPRTTRSRLTTTAPDRRSQFSVGLSTLSTISTRTGPLLLFSFSPSSSSTAVTRSAAAVVTVRSRAKGTSKSYHPPVSPVRFRTGVSSRALSASDRYSIDPLPASQIG